ncbi:tyrosine-protein phosphatase 10D-like isoform X2 [Haemaphysalis longicornis]
MGRPRTKRTLSAASTLRTGFCTFLVFIAPVIALSRGSCPQLPSLNITRRGHTLLIQRTESSHANDSSCICYPVDIGEQSDNITCSTNFIARVFCQPLPLDKANVTEVSLEEKITSGNASVCLLSDCGERNCSLYDSVPHSVSIGELNYTFVNSSTVSIRWSVEGDSQTTTAEHFRVAWCAEEANCSVETACLSNAAFEQGNVTDRSYTFGDLKPATSLWVQVSPVGPQGNSSIGCFETSTEEIEPVTDVKPLLEGLDGLRVTWKDPKEHNNVTDYYKVRYCVEKRHKSCPLNHIPFLNNCSRILTEESLRNNDYDISSLESDAILVIGISAFRRYASGLETNSTEVTECIPTPSAGTITDFTPHNISSREASLSWKLQRNPQQLLKPSAYNITWCVTGLTDCPPTCQGAHQASNRTMSEALEIQTLQPWSAVIAQVHGLYTNGSEEIQLGEPRVICFRTAAEAPGQPVNLQITTVETTSATVSWAEPKVKNGPLDGYDLSVCAANDSAGLSCEGENVTQAVTLNGSSKTEYTLTGLDPWTDYIVVLVAFNRGPDNDTKMASPEATKVFQTDAAVPGSITKFSFTEVTNTSIKLLWTQPDFLGGNLDHYNVTHCKVERCSAHNQYGLYSVSLQADCRTQPVNTTSIHLTNLEPWTSYELSVAAVSELRDGTHLTGSAAELCAVTKQGVPGKVADMAVSTTADTLLVKWRRPEAPRGEIAGYKIVACIDSGRELPGCEEVFVSGDKSTVEYVFQNRKPWTSYTVTLSAENRDEDGGVLEGEAEMKTVKTLPGAPSEPLNVVGTAERGKFVNVSWEAPSSPRGPLDGYSVSWLIFDWLGRLTGRGSRVTTELSASIANWKPYSNYTFYVKAFHKLRDGGSLYGGESSVTIRTAVDVPGPPMLQWDVGSRYAAVYLGDPEYPNGPVDGFLWCYCTASEVCIQNTSHGATCIGKEQTCLKQLLLLHKLRPWTEHKFAARAFNLDSEGHQLKGAYAEVSFKTDPAEPSAPVNFTLVKRQSRSLFLNWSAPAHRNGDLEGYVVTWSLPNSLPINSSDVPTQNILIKGLDPYTQYDVEVRAYNVFGGHRLEGPRARLSGRTLAEAPGPVRELTALPFKNNTVRLAWRPPVVLRGELFQYIVRYNGTKPGKHPMNDMVIESPLLLSSCACKGVPLACAFEVDELPAEYNYTFDVRGRNTGIVTDGDAYEPVVRVTVPAGDPRPPRNVSLLSAVDIPAAPQPDTQKAFLIYSDLFDDWNGAITSYAVVVGSPELIRDTVNKDVSWQESQSHAAAPHIVTPSHWNPFRKGLSSSDPLNCSALRRKSNARSCILGWEQCDGERSSCNGPLKQGTQYAMYVIGYTQGGSRASEPEVFVTEIRPVVHSSSTGATVGGIVTAILIMVIIIGVFIVYRRQQERKEQPTSKTSSTDVSNMNNSLDHLVQMSDANGSAEKPSPPDVQYEPPIEMVHHVLKDINKPIPKKDFKEHLAMMQEDSGYRFADEYERLVELSPQYPSDVARQPANSKKNRFTNIHPFDKSRVPLSVVGDDEQSSYINASFVKGYNAEREYIAAQGPNALTVNDFWRMIWEHDVKIIIMLTQLVEGNKKKCERYWPEDNKEHSYGCVQVRKDSSAERSDFILTELKIKSDDSSKWRNVQHVFFTAWKDHGTPESPETLIRFVRTCQRMFGPRGGAQPPILVHCTAGVGRTGTFIALDMCLQKLEVEDDVDIFHLILELRESRRCMVQNEKQYTYLYNCVDTVIDELYGRSSQNDPIYENVGSLMSGSSC